MSLRITTAFASQKRANRTSPTPSPSVDRGPAMSTWERALRYRALNHEGIHMLHRALSGYEKKYGRGHPSTLPMINNFGLLYEKLDLPERARQMFQQALDGYQALDHKSTSTLDAANNLGLIYIILGRLDKAEELLLRAFRGKQKLLGPDDMSTLDTANNLGLLYLDWRKFESAEAMLCRALIGREMVLGLGHIATLGTASNLGLLYTDLGRLDVAEKMHQRALDGCKKTVGLNGMRTCVSALTIMWGYASFCATSNLMDDARRWYMQALTGYRDVLGADHSTCQALLVEIEALDNKTNDPLQDCSPIGGASTHTTDSFLLPLRKAPGWRRKILRKLALMRKRSGSSTLFGRFKGYARLD
ncbi:hypothetical protein E8E12_001634 [Didymella heteroderae]|uniref:Uncharacterized protein n=1 Tax=Didymella heteroderae TaxID=1769908 RepID=A0A9P4WGF6_9PLEO|nr:hypothetical protein E8E12_001634 [Didymella heteroderae]